MTNSVGFDGVSPRDEMGDVLSRVRQLDPTSEDAAIHRYMREMAEADALLDSVDLSNAPLLVPFSAPQLERAER